MKIRPVGGMLADTMKKVADIDPDVTSVCEWLNRDPMVTSGFMPPAEPSDLRQHHVGLDHRIGWDTWLVALVGVGPVAQTNMPVPGISG